jgi:hypothetical protein
MVEIAQDVGAVILGREPRTPTQDIDGARDALIRTGRTSSGEREGNPDGPR